MNKDDRLIDTQKILFYTWDNARELLKVHYNEDLVSILDSAYEQAIDFYLSNKAMKGDRNVL